MFYFLKLAFKGCKPMPYVDKHPGIPFVAIMVLVTAISVANKGFLAMILAFIFSAFIYIPLLLIGGYGRAKTSHAMTRAKKAKACLQAYVDLYPDGAAQRIGLKKGKDGLFIWKDNPPYSTVPNELLKPALTDALMIDKRLEIPKSMEMKTYKSNPLSAHDKMKAHTLLSTQKGT